ncbi:unnamed protein product [Gongylonema pulchrum]|uniref:Prenyltransferase alpha-alpha toroid domain-containing protein n=1 Tax=Gongylonema pulchrum TaxID=637853 RepID=A0A183DWP4_9BILA|nr:unnamed protein product [Gongylonema pulchrum]
MGEVLLTQEHLNFLRRHLQTLPGSYRKFDSNRATILFFTLSSLDVLGKLEEEVDEDKRQELINWIYRLQLKSDSETSMGDDKSELVRSVNAGIAQKEPSALSPDERLPKYCWKDV